MDENKIEVDSRGDVCPVPVVKTLKALGELEGPGVVETLVDNKVAVQNLIRMGTTKGCEVTTEQCADKEWRVRVSTDKTVEVASGEAEAVVCEVPATRNVVVQICSDTMGEGDEELGHNLLKGFIFSLTQLDELPRTILLYNGGARLTCEGSASLDDFRGLADAGVEILTCGTCLDFYGITDKLAVGEATNMYAITQKLTSASCVVRP